MHGIHDYVCQHLSGLCEGLCALQQQSSNMHLLVNLSPSPALSTVMLPKPFLWLERINQPVGYLLFCLLLHTGDPHIASELLQLLGRGGPGVCASVSGIVWELAAAPTPAQQLLDAGAVPALSAVLQQTARAANWSSKKGSKAGTKGDSSKGSKGKSSKGASSNSSGAKKARGKDGKGRPESAAVGKRAGGALGPPKAQPAAVLMADPEAAAAVALCNTTGMYLRVG